MKTIITNARLVFPDGIKQTNIVFDNEQILDISDNVIINADKIIDARGNFVVPGLANCFFDGDLEDVEKLSTSGATTIFDFSNNLLVTEKLLEKGFRVYRAVGAFDENTNLSEDYLINKINESSAHPILFVKDPLTCDESQFCEAIKFAKKHNLLLCTCVAESLEDEGQLDKIHNCNSIELLESYGFLDYPHLLIGGVYIDKTSVELLSNYSSNICITPTRSLRSGSGIAPLYSFIKNAINFVVGGNNFNMFSECVLSADLQSGILNEKDIVDDNNLKNEIQNNLSNMLNVSHALNVGGVPDLLILDENNIKNISPINIRIVIANGYIIYNKLS